MRTSLQIKVAGLVGYVAISTALVLGLADETEAPVQPVAVMVTLP